MITSKQSIIAALAGVTSSILMLAGFSAPIIGFPLLVLCSLPIAIASLGWGTRTGFAAAAIGSLCFALSLNVSGAIAYALLFGMSIAYLGHLIGLSRQDGPTEQEEWYPLGDVIFKAALIGGGLFGIGFLAGNFEPDIVADAFITNIEEQIETLDAAQRTNFEETVKLNIRLLPYILPFVWLIVVFINFGFAAKIVRLSNLFQRPSYTLKTAELPKFTVAIAAGCGLFSFIAAPPLVYAGEAVVGAMGAALFLTGCATIHIITRNLPIRGFLLGVVYGSVLFLGFPVILIACLGLADFFLKIRQRHILAHPL